MIRAFVQARMSSSRFPGKMLAPMLGQPMVRHVLDRAAVALGKENVVLCTSVEPSDDPLALYAASLGYATVRGSRDDTVRRFQDALRQCPCDAFYRVCGDSPLLDPGLLEHAGRRMKDGVDLVTNVFPRSFAKGHSVEVIRSATYLAIDSERLTVEEREHATAVLYRNPTKYTIVNLRSPQDASTTSYALDSIDDLQRLSALVTRDGFPRAAKPAE